MFSESTESSIKSYEESYLKYEELESMRMNEDDVRRAIERFEQEAESMLYQQSFFEKLAAENQAIDLVIFEDEF